VYEHILVAERALGRPIERHELVHHINCVKNDNNPDNLFVCADNTEHLKIHGTLNKCVAQLIAMGVLHFNRTSRSYEVITSDDGRADAALLGHWYATTKGAVGNP
jgi:hypothetical protein